MADLRLPLPTVWGGGRGVRRAVRRRAAAPAFALALVLLLAGCDLQKTLDDLAGKPSASSAVGTVGQPPISVPSGPMLYCITNIGHTLEAYSLAQARLLPETRTYLDLDPVGPWFSGGLGYYVSRVNTNGAGSNALIEFDPRTAQERRRYTFPANSNPNSLLILPTTPDVAWVPLRGSTFNSPYGPDAIVVVRNLAGAGPLTAQLLDLAGLAGPRTAVLNGPSLHSIIRLLWDAACPAPAAGGRPCVYGVVNGFDGALRQGLLLVLQPDPVTSAPMLLDAVPLGLNPLEDLYLDAAWQRLWIVNNGGFAPLPPTAGSPTGTLQVISTPLLGDGSAGNETVATLSAGFAPVGLFALNAGTAWLTTYPHDAVLPVDLAALSVALNPSPALPTLTGPLIPTTLVPALFAGRGGFGPAHLVSLSPAGAVLQDVDLLAGNGPVGCAEMQVP